MSNLHLKKLDCRPSAGKRACNTADNSSEKSIALLGGTFDPIHLGHLSIAQTIQTQFHFSSFLFLPAHLPVHKQADASISQRVDMINLVLEAMPIEHASLCLQEVNRSAPSYMIDTLRELRQIHPNTAISLILGWDSFLSLPDWHQFESLLSFCHFLVINRPRVVWQLNDTLQSFIQKHQTDEFSKLQIESCGLIYFFHAGLYEISSSEIRERVRHHQSIQDMVPKAVETYIRAHKLYL
jgi:nicotinate-nucleotide adenylyltransferase